MQLAQAPRAVKILLGLLISVVGILPPAVFFYTGNSPQPEVSEILVLVLPAYLISLIAFVGSRLLFQRTFNRVVGGIAGSYGLMIVAGFIVAAIQGALDQMLGWLPIILIFGFMGFAPLVGLTLLGTYLMFWKNPDREKSQTS
ncbi:MAG: hypothetical protein HKN23_14010 [Verrucomicrobiales bacterium]|nr:hypothetical protein [Verrucomicrobiales bacterium]